MPFERGAFELGPGMTSTVIRSGKPLRLGTAEEQFAAGAIDVGGVGRHSHGWACPIPAGDRVIGVVGLESESTHAFSEGDERVLATLAASMGVALENARLFTETKRLLTETDERAAELAIINGIQQGLAAELDMQAMYDLVGAKIQEIFDAQVVDIGIYDEVTERLHFPYAIERGVRFPDEPMELIGFRKHVMETGQPLLLDHDMTASADRIRQPRRCQRRTVEVVAVRALACRRPRRSACSRSRTSTTSTPSMSATSGCSRPSGRVSASRSRTPAWWTRRAGATPSSRSSTGSSRGSPRSSTCRRCTTWSATRSRRSSTPRSSTSACTTVTWGWSASRTRSSGASGSRTSPCELIGFRRLVVESREPLLVNDRATERSIELGQGHVLQGEEPKSLLFAPLIVGDEARGVISLQNLDREFAFSDADVTC